MSGLALPSPLGTISVLLSGAVGFLLAGMSDELSLPCGPVAVSARVILGHNTMTGSYLAPKCLLCVAISHTGAELASPVFWTLTQPFLSGGAGGS